MTKQFLSLLAVSVAALSLSACMDEGTRATNMAPGHYENSSSSVNRYGTRTEKEYETDVYRDADGDKRAVVKSKTTRDPKGLLNKSTSTSTRVYEEDR